MKNKYYLLLTVFSLLISCVGGNKGSENPDTLYVFLEDILQKEGTEPLSSVASEIIYIPLETNDNSLLRNINHIGYKGDSYVISDSENIYLFDQDGKYIKKIAQKGNGPADYANLYLSDVIIDPMTNYFYLFASQKVLKFDENTDFIHYCPIKK